MDAIEIIESIESTSEFTETKEKNGKIFLAHVFIMYDGDNLMDTQVGYYNPETSKMFSFMLSNNMVTAIPETDVFQKPDTEIKPLNQDMIKFDFENARDKAENLIRDKYGVSASKKIFILQSISDKQVWNITFLTSSFSTINIRIDSSTGEILKDEEVNLIDMNK